MGKTLTRTVGGILFVSLLVCAGCAPLAVGAAGGAAAGGVETAKAAEDRDYGAATYAATILSNAVYLPAKVVFAGAGAATSGVVYLASLGDGDVSRDIWNAAVGGNYVITPGMIEGRRQVEFVG